MISIQVKGVTYKLRYVTERDGHTIAVLDTDGQTVPYLEGDFGDEWTLVKKGNSFITNYP